MAQAVHANSHHELPVVNLFATRIARIKHATPLITVEDTGNALQSEEHVSVRKTTRRGSQEAAAGGAGDSKRPSDLHFRFRMNLPKSSASS